MGSVLALAGNKKTAENTALYFVHNAQGIGIGDYRELAKESQWLKDISDLIANLYSEYTSLSFKEAVDLMDADSQFFGSDLELLGFEIVEAGNRVSEAEARVNSKLKFSEMKEKIKNEKYSDDLEKVAASIDYEKFGLKNKKQKHNLTNAQIPAENSAGKNTQEGNIMTLAELLSQNPAAKTEYDNLFAEHGKSKFEAGKQLMQERMTAAGKYLAPDSVYPAAIKAIAVDVLNCKKSVEALETTVSAFDALREGQNSENAQDEQPDDVPSQQLPQPSEDGEIKNDADFGAAVAEMRRNRGLEV
jgi:hypothetical protein